MSNNKNYFEMYELSCNCGCGRYNITPKLINMLNEARELAGLPFIINSGCRCNQHNLEIGGRPNSAHLRGFAVDIKADLSQQRYVILSSLLAVGFTRVGVYKTFIHADCDPVLPQRVMWYGGN